MQHLTDFQTGQPIWWGSMEVAGPSITEAGSHDVGVTDFILPAFSDRLDFISINIYVTYVFSNESGQGGSPSPQYTMINIPIPHN